MDKPVDSAVRKSLPCSIPGAKLDLPQHPPLDHPQPSQTLASSAGYFSDPDRCSSALSEASSSWAEEVEGEGTRRGVALLQHLEDGLYSDKPLPGEMGEECQFWRQTFPHFRVEGKAAPIHRVVCPAGRPDSPTAEEEEIFAAHGTYRHSSVSREHAL